MKNSEVLMMVLRRAVQICNGADALGDALNVSGEALERMLAGAEEIPLATFTQAVGLLLEGASQVQQGKLSRQTGSVKAVLVRMREWFQRNF